MRLKRVLHIPDTHAPMHDKRALELMLDIAKQFKPDEIVFLGDFLDFYSVSRHDKNPVKDYKLFFDELKEGRRVLDYVLEKTNARSYVFLEGNHEKRLEKYIAGNAPKLGGIFKPEEMLGLPSSVLFIPYGLEGYYKIGKLICTHGSIAGDNVAAKMLRKYKSSVIFGHVHRSIELHSKDIHGQDFVALSPGWLGNERHAGDYLNSPSDWSKGICLTWHKSNGDFYYQLINFKESKNNLSCIYNGEIYVK